MHFLLFLNQMPHVAYGVLGQTKPHIIEVRLFTSEIQCNFYHKRVSAKISSERFNLGKSSGELLFMKDDDKIIRYCLASCCAVDSENDNNPSGLSAFCVCVCVRKIAISGTELST